MGVVPWLAPEFPPDALMCLLIANFSWAPHDVDLLLCTGAWLLFIASAWAAAADSLLWGLPVLTWRCLNMALRTAAASDWLRCRKNALIPPLLLFSEVRSPLAMGAEVELLEIEVACVSPDLWRDFLKLLKSPLRPPEPIRGLNSLVLLLLLSISSSTRLGRAFASCKRVYSR